MANELNIPPTKGALLSVQKSLSLSRLGFELLDRKRSILIRELMLLVDKAKLLRGQIGSTYAQAYEALQQANITLGVVQEIAQQVPVENGVAISYRSVMGVEIPNVQLEQHEPTLCYGLSGTNSHFDYAFICFQKVKEITVLLTEVENSIYRLADAIGKTQRRANALEHIVIPRYERTVRFITDALEEKDREEFSRMKVIKASKARSKQE